MVSYVNVVGSGADVSLALSVDSVSKMFDDAEVDVSGSEADIVDVLSFCTI